MVNNFSICENKTINLEREQNWKREHPWKKITSRFWQFTVLFGRAVFCCKTVFFYDFLTLLGIKTKAFLIYSFEEEFLHFSNSTKMHPNILNWVEIGRLGKPHYSPATKILRSSPLSCWNVRYNWAKNVSVHCDHHCVRNTLKRINSISWKTFNSFIRPQYILPLLCKPIYMYVSGQNQVVPYGFLVHLQLLRLQSVFLWNLFFSSNSWWTIVYFVFTSKFFEKALGYFRKKKN